MMGLSELANYVLSLRSRLLCRLGLDGVTLQHYVFLSVSILVILSRLLEVQHLELDYGVINGYKMSQNMASGPYY